MRFVWLPGGLMCAAAASSLGGLDAACPCQASGPPQVAMNQVHVGGGLAPSPEIDPLPPPPMIEQPAAVPLASPQPSPPVISSAPIGTPIPGTNRFGMAPPPGTLGKTYQRRTTLIPDEKHPRIGIVNVHVGEDVDVTARGLKSKWNGEYWQLESEAPLLPGVPHIYAIKTEKKLPSGQKQVDVRWVRLIMGRVVDLEL